MCQLFVSFGFVFFVENPFKIDVRVLCSLFKSHNYPNDAKVGTLACNQTVLGPY